MDSAEWGAFRAIIALPPLAAKRNLILSYADPARDAIEWAALEETMRAWSHGEQVLMRLARTLFTGIDYLSVDELRILDPQTAIAVLGIIRDTYWPVPAVQSAQTPWRD